MRILLTGSTGYIGRRLLPLLLEDGHHVFCCVRDIRRFEVPAHGIGQIELVEADFMEPKSLEAIPDDIDVAYYLIHSMSTSTTDFESLEAESAANFKKRLERTRVRQVVYLSGIVNEDKLSRHLLSRKKVEEILSGGGYHLTTLRAGIIVGSGSASFEIIRDLVEKLPLMITPKWLNTKSQPISVRNVLEFLKGVLLDESCYDKDFDIGGPEVLSYKEMLLQFAEVRGLKRIIIALPVMTPKLSSYWLYFVTTTSYKLAVNLVHSMKVEVICRPSDLTERLGIRLIPYIEAVGIAFNKVRSQDVISRWTDAQSSDILKSGIAQLTDIPVYGCITEKRSIVVKDEAQTLDRIWSIGGENGWYYGDWMWGLRGFADRLIGGVGLRRGRKSAAELTVGESLDFWRVVKADRENKRLVLYAEMKLPGEAWLELRIDDGVLTQRAVFRPLGVWGRAYWYALLPFHLLIFHGMLKRLAS